MGKVEEIKQIISMTKKYLEGECEKGVKYIRKSPAKTMRKQEAAAKLLLKK